MRSAAANARPPAALGIDLLSDARTAGGHRLISPNVLHVLKHWLAWPRAIRSLLGGMAAVALVLAVAWLLLVPAADWLAHHDVGSATGPRLQTARDAARGQLLTLGAGLFAAAALVFTARNFALSRRTFELTEQRNATGRYATAIGQLGSDKLDVRIGGIYALERIARDSAKDHPTVMEVLTAFIREHSRDQWPLSHPHGRKKMRPDLQSALTVVGRRDAQRDIQRLDLTMADLSSARLTGANLADAQLAFADLSYAYLSKATFSGGCLLGVILHGASIGGADFTGADLAGADLTFALGAADLNGANFAGARLDGAKWPENVPVPGGWKLRRRLWQAEAGGHGVRAGTGRPAGYLPATGASPAARLVEPGFGYWPRDRRAARKACPSAGGSVTCRPGTRPSGCGSPGTWRRGMITYWVVNTAGGLGLRD